MSDERSTTLVDRWQSRFEGRLLAPAHHDYPAACRIWNGMIERTPALIARCTSNADVATAIELARSEELPLSVRGGGHGVAGNAICQHGVVVDLTLLKRVAVDPAVREAVAGAGLLWGEFDAAAESHGLATTGGQVSHTGIAGLTLGGGLGYLMSKHGATCDNLLSVELVAADGEVMTASEDVNPDLFWAMRGAGANFGVVTSFRYRLHPLPGVFAGMMLHPRDRAAELAVFYREFLRDSPDELDTTFGFLNGPDGTPLVGVIGVYAGPSDEGEDVLRPLRKFGPPVVDTIRPMRYTEVQQMLDAAVPVGNRYYWKSNFVDTLRDELVEVLRQGADAMPSPYSLIMLFETKGAIRRVAKEKMAFDHRDANFEMSIIANWTDPVEDARNMAWARDLWKTCQPFVMDAVYSNHMTSDEPIERVRSAYGAKYARLERLKAQYDPTNLFRMNHNIPPQA